MTSLISFFHRLFFIGASVFLGAFITTNHLLSVVLATVGLIIIVISLGCLIVKSIKAKDINVILGGGGACYSWAGFYVLLSLLLLNNGLTVLAAITGVLSLYYIASTITSSLKAK